MITPARHTLVLWAAIWIADWICLKLDGMLSLLRSGQRGDKCAAGGPLFHAATG